MGVSLTLGRLPLTKARAETGLHAMLHNGNDLIALAPDTRAQRRAPNDLSGCGRNV
jgi:hypothetical protein